jgi:serine/threonine protein kinase
MDCRIPIPQGEKINLGNTDYTIISLVGFGSNAFVYLAQYTDNLHKDKTHTVLLKELFPYHQKGLIRRGDDGQILVADEVQDLFKLHRSSFLRGNITHLDFQNVNADKASVNINSYEANNTLYTVLAYEGGETLRNVTDDGKIKNSLYDITACMLNIIDALAHFHNNNLLHLDISPDNILLMPLDEGKSEKYRRVILLDYNSAWNKDELLKNDGIVLSKKEHYSAPELRLNDKKSISPATDLFSVCAIFLEYLQGQPLDFSRLCSSKKVMPQKIELLEKESKEVRQKAAAILHKGLKLPPKRRYQSTEELKADFVELLKRIKDYGTIARIKKLAITAAAILTVCGGLVWGAVTINNIGYPRTQREITLNTTAMNGVITVITGLDLQIRNERQVLENLLAVEPEAAQENIRLALEENDAWNYDGIDSGLFANTPLDLALLEDIYRQPQRHNEWQRDILTRFSYMVSADSIYTEQYKREAVENYLAYLDTYERLVFFKIYKLLLPLNESGRSGVLNDLRHSTEIGRVYTDFEPPQNVVDLDNIIIRLQNDLNALERRLNIIRTAEGE